MKYLRVSGILVAAALLGVSPATADNEDGPELGRMSPGYTYFNRPGATMAMSRDEIATCVDDSSALAAFQTQTLPGRGGGLLSDALFGSGPSAQRGVAAAALENCMVVRGWRVVRLDDAEGEALSKLARDALSAQLTPWIGADAPHGTIVRIWRNDAARAGANYFAYKPAQKNGAQLSLLAIGPDITAAVAEAVTRRPPTVMGDAALVDGNDVTTKPTLPEKASLKPTAPALLDAAPPGSAIIIVNVKTTRGIFFEFWRMFDSRTGMDSSARSISVKASREGKFYALVVPPGVWKIGSIGDGLLRLDFCFGSPGFVLKPGDVVYTGLLDLDQPKLAPQLDLVPVKAWLGPSRAAARLQAAAYTNGLRNVCFGTGAYALEFDGTPFVKGYALGSRAPAFSATPARP